jgi:hypothetical protein
MGKSDLEEFYEWFMSNLPYCIEELMQLVRSTPGFENWNPDYSPDSLNSLGDWFSLKANKRGLSQKEIDALSSSKSGSVETSPWDLTDETKTLAVYVGMYYGQVALENFPSLKWKQQLENKKLADFGQPVIVGGGFVPCNPVRVANAFAWGIIDGSRSGSRLRETYDYWTKLSK